MSKGNAKQNKKQKRARSAVSFRVLALEEIEQLSRAEMTILYGIFTDLALLVINHDVVRFHVSVHDPPRMAEIERLQQLKDVVALTDVGIRLLAC